MVVTGVESPRSAEFSSQRRAIRLIANNLRLEEIEANIDRIRELASGRIGLHFETESFVVPIEAGEEAVRQGLATDVTQIALELDQRTEGYRIVRVEHNTLGLDGDPIGIIINDYSNGFFTQVDSSGRTRGIIPPENAGVVFSGSSYITVAEPPFEFFDTLEDAKAWQKRPENQEQNRRFHKAFLTKFSTARKS